MERWRGSSKPGLSRPAGSGLRNALLASESNRSEGSARGPLRGRLRRPLEIPRSLSTLARRDAAAHRKTASTSLARTPGETGAQDIPHGFERELKKLDSEILKKVSISKIIEDEMAVDFVIKGSGESVHRVAAKKSIISTIPLHDCYDYVDRDEKEVKESLDSLKYMDIIFVYLLLDKEQVSNDHWLYFPDEDIIFNRSVEFKSWSKKMTPEGKTALCLDITCFEGDETWNKSNQVLVKECIESSVKVGLIEESEVFDSLVIRVKDAYPFYDLDYKSKLLKIVTFLEGKNVVHCLGRTGIFRYNNSDGSIEMGIQLAKKLISDESGASALDYKVKEISY